jgi:hypothetical protein
VAVISDWLPAPALRVAPALRGRKPEAIQNIDKRQKNIDCAAIFNFQFSIKKKFA